MERPTLKKAAMTRVAMSSTLYAGTILLRIKWQVTLEVVIIMPFILSNLKMSWPGRDLH